jgi:flagellar biosynthesis protein FlhG
MADQAEALRRLVRQSGAPVDGPTGRVVLVIGAQPAVGTTTISRNLAVAIQRQGGPTALVDADLDDPQLLSAWPGPPRYSLAELTTGRRTVREVLQPGPGGLPIIAGCCGSDEAMRVPGAGALLADALQRLACQRRVVVDVGRGDVWQELYELASILLVVTTPENDVLRHAYAWMKRISTRRTAAQIWVIANRIHDADVAQHALRRLILATDRFLNLDVCPAGFLPVERCFAKPDASARSERRSFPSRMYSQTLERLVVRWMRDDRTAWPAVSTVGEKLEKTESTTDAQPITSPSLFAPTVVKM